MIRADREQLPPIIRARLDEVERLCRRHGVKQLDVFGSALRDDFAEASDIDFAVEFKPDAPHEGWGGPYLDLLLALKDVFAREVDLVSYRAVRNPYFKRELDETRVNVYAE